MTYKIIDLFAGPGGLGEGFAALNDGKTFSIAVSAEMEASAHATLTLRSFFRHVQRENPAALSAYYDFCNSATAPHPRDLFPVDWAVATNEARQLTLGQPDHNEQLDEITRGKKLREDQTVLIGGPPCQAYSLVGRSRNMGTAGYVAEKDHRHFLYKEYLRILAKARPAVFVMENVKGILSAKVGGRQIFRTSSEIYLIRGRQLGRKVAASTPFIHSLCQLAMSTIWSPAALIPKISLFMLRNMESPKRGTV